MVIGRDEIGGSGQLALFVHVTIRIHKHTCMYVLQTLALLLHPTLMFCNVFIS